LTESLQPYQLRAAGLWILALLALSSCDSSFEPIQENDRYIYSIYGYLDAAADTQWVRVMPVHEKLFAGPEPIDATVTLENLESGESQVMNDSLFQYAANTYAWNFWTPMELEPTGTYRLTAERSDGVTSHVTVTLPESFPARSWSKPFSRFRGWASGSSAALSTVTISSSLALPCCSRR
jgi:hypothetical protein